MQNNKKEIIKSLGADLKDTGSSQVQIALLSEKISKLTKHFEKFKKDKHSEKGLIEAVNKRKRLLVYLKRRDPATYNKVLEQLKIRK